MLFEEHLQTLKASELGGDFHGGFLQSVRCRFVHVLDTQRVDSVALAGARVSLPVENVA